METAATIALFTQLVTAAAGDLGIPAPKVAFGPLAMPGVLAQVPPCPPHFECAPRIEITAELLRWSMLQRSKRKVKSHLQCIARHEVSHVYLGHLNIISFAAEADLRHDQVATLMWKRWKQDSTCPQPEVIL